MSNYEDDDYYDEDSLDYSNNRPITYKDYLAGVFAFTVLIGLIVAIFSLLGK